MQSYAGMSIDRHNAKQPLSTVSRRLWGWLPLILGGLFPLIVRLEHWLYSKSKISARAAIGIEAVYLLATAVAIAAALAMGVELFKNRKPMGVLWVVVSVLACLGLLAMGIEDGAAIVYAT